MRALVEAGDRQAGVFEDVRREALRWRADGMQTAVHIMERERLVVLETEPHQEGGGYLPCGYAVALRRMAESAAVRGSLMGGVGRVLVPLVGTQFYQTVGGVGVVGNVGQVVGRVGVEEVDARLGTLGEEGRLYRLRGEVGGGYYEVGSKALRSAGVQRFAARMWGEELRGMGEHARGVMTHGVGGVARAWRGCPEAGKMMKAIGELEESWRGYALGEDQVRGVYLAGYHECLWATVLC